MRGFCGQSDRVYDFKSFIGEFNTAERVTCFTSGPLFESGFDERIYVRGDTTVDYGRVVQVMATMNQAGFRRIAMVSETPAGQ